MCVKWGEIIISSRTGLNASKWVTRAFRLFFMSFQNHCKALLSLTKIVTLQTISCKTSKKSWLAQRNFPSFPWFLLFFKVCTQFHHTDCNGASHDKLCDWWSLRTCNLGNGRNVLTLCFSKEELRISSLKIVRHFDLWTSARDSLNWLFKLYLSGRKIELALDFFTL